MNLIQVPRQPLTVPMVPGEFPLLPNNPFTPSVAAERSRSAVVDARTTGWLAWISTSLAHQETLHDVGVLCQVGPDVEDGKVALLPVIRCTWADRSSTGPFDTVTAIPVPEPVVLDEELEVYAVGLLELLLDGSQDLELAIEFGIRDAGALADTALFLHLVNSGPSPAIVELFGLTDPRVRFQAVCDALDVRPMPLPDVPALRESQAHAVQLAEEGRSMHDAMPAYFDAALQRIAGPEGALNPRLVIGIARAFLFGFHGVAP